MDWIYLQNFTSTKWWVNYDKWDDDKGNFPLLRYLKVTQLSEMIFSTSHKHFNLGNLLFGKKNSTQWDARCLLEKTFGYKIKYCYCCIRAAGLRYSHVRIFVTFQLMWKLSSKLTHGKIESTRLRLHVRKAAPSGRIFRRTVWLRINRWMIFLSSKFSIDPDVSFWGYNSF